MLKSMQMDCKAKLCYVCVMSQSLAHMQALDVGGPKFHHSGNFKTLDKKGIDVGKAILGTVVAYGIAYESFPAPDPGKVVVGAVLVAALAGEAVLDWYQVIEDYTAADATVVEQPIPADSEYPTDGSLPPGTIVEDPQSGGAAVVEPDVDTRPEDGAHLVASMRQATSNAWQLSNRI